MIPHRYDRQGTETTCINDHGFDRILELERDGLARGGATGLAAHLGHRASDRRLRDLARPAREVPAYETSSAYLWKHLDEWFTFLSHSEVEPTNWEVERAIRPAVVNRKVRGGNRTWAGACAQEVLMSVLETCRRAGRPGLEFVSQTLRGFANPRLPRPILLTPR
jgi:transposase